MSVKPKTSNFGLISVMCCATCLCTTHCRVSQTPSTCTGRCVCIHTGNAKPGERNSSTEVNDTIAQHHVYCFMLFWPGYNYVKDLHTQLPNKQPILTQNTTLKQQSLLTCPCKAFRFPLPSLARWPQRSKFFSCSLFQV